MAVGADDSVGPKNVAKSPQIPVKTVQSARADVGIGPYNQIGVCSTNSPEDFCFHLCLPLDLSGASRQHSYPFWPFGPFPPDRGNRPLSGEPWGCCISAIFILGQYRINTQIRIIQ